SEMPTEKERETYYTACALDLNSLRLPRGAISLEATMKIRTHLIAGPDCDNDPPKPPGGNE
ncbi:MAG: hypothetical protein QNK37_18850, partial [Acidobacteriota bacterium]|nr:hypothetical protein [Acidobacteriota bacterium]